MKIGLCGSHSTGKTTLIEKFVKLHPEFVPVTEGIRNLVKTHKLEKEYNEGNETLQFIYMYNHLLNTKNLENYLSDRTLIDYYAYYLNFGFKKFKSVYEEIIINNLNKYDVICYIPIEFECENDNFRFDKKMQHQINDYIIEILNKFDVHPVIISGSFEERLKQLENLL